VALAVEERDGEREDVTDQALHHAELDDLDDPLLHHLVVVIQEAAHDVGEDEQPRDDPESGRPAERGRDVIGQPARLAERCAQEVSDQQDHCQRGSGAPERRDDETREETPLAAEERGKVLQGQSHVCYADESRASALPRWAADAAGY
jgi:hypothetical protein